MIPNDTKTILDVGCGSGEITKQLLEQNYFVDAIAPPSVMTSIARNKLKDLANIYECRFEELNIDKIYDLVVFVESFQFINLKKAIEQGIKYSKKYILIADVFRARSERGPIGGGHQHSTFLKTLNEFNLKEIKKIDVTKHIAPTFDLENDCLQNFVKPLLKVVKRMRDNSVFLKTLCFLYKNKLKRLNEKYLTNNNRNSESFKEYKTYQFILLEIK